MVTPNIEKMEPNYAVKAEDVKTLEVSVPLSLKNCFQNLQGQPNSQYEFVDSTIINLASNSFLSSSQRVPNFKETHEQAKINESPSSLVNMLNPTLQGGEHPSCPAFESFSHDSLSTTLQKIMTAYLIKSYMILSSDVLLDVENEGGISFVDQAANYLLGAVTSGFDTIGINFVFAKPMPEIFGISLETPERPFLLSQVLPAAAPLPFPAVSPPEEQEPENPNEPQPQLRVIGIRNDIVEEDDLNNLVSIGNNEDGSIGKQIATGSFTPIINIAEVGPVHFALDNSVLNTLPDIFSKGEIVNFTIVGDTLFGFAGGREVLTFQLQDNGNFVFTLIDQLDHAQGDGENILAIPFGTIVKVSDENGHSIHLTDQNFIINAQDDVPVANDQVVIETVAGTDTNLLLTIDISSSMGDTSGLTGLTRLDVTKAAAIELLERYDSLGDVMVQLVTFSSTATDEVSNWVDIPTAKNIILGLTAFGDTNYDDAITTAIAAFATAGKIVGARNVAYFLSDGKPNQPLGSEGINSSEQTIWENFILANSIKSFAIGIGTGLSATELNPIGFDGTQNTDVTPLLVTDLSQLASTLSETVIFGGLSGTLSTSFSIGADETGPLPETFSGNIRSVTIPGDHTYTYDQGTNSIIVSGLGSTTFNFDPLTHVLAIASASLGAFNIDMDDGSYNFNFPALFANGQHQIIPYTVIDYDGDTATANLSITASHDFAPIIRDDHVITNINGSGAEIPIPDIALIYNDNDPEGEQITIIGGASNTIDVTSVLHSGDVFTFTDNDEDGGQFTYTGTDGTFTDTGNVTVTRVSGNTLTGTGLGEILVTTVSNTTINANEGNDVLITGAVNTTLNGDDGNDLLIGLAGNNDTLNGGNGNDILSPGTGVNNALDGGPGIDLIDFSNGTSGLTFTLVQSSSNTSFDESGAGLGDGTYANMEGVIGTPFADHLTGSSGDDYIVGNGGADVLDGTSGQDTFVFTSADAVSPFHTVTILNFMTGVGADADILDLSKLLKGVNDSTPEGTLADFLQFVASGGNTTIALKADGSGTPDFNIQLDAIDLTAGGTQSDAQIIHTLLQNNNIHVG